MSDIVRATVSCDIALTVQQLAEFFCQITDDAQAQFFVHVDRIMGMWDAPGSRCMQIKSIGDHLRECKCSTQGAREWIRELHECIQP